VPIVFAIEDLQWPNLHSRAPPALARAESPPPAHLARADRRARIDVLSRGWADMTVTADDRRWPLTPERSVLRRRALGGAPLPNHLYGDHRQPRQPLHDGCSTTSCPEMVSRVTGVAALGQCSGDPRPASRLVASDRHSDRPVTVLEQHVLERPGVAAPSSQLRGSPRPRADGLRCGVLL